MMRQMKLLFGTAVLVAGLTHQTQAGLIGDTVDFARFINGSPNEAQSAVVDGSIEFRDRATGTRWLDVDVADNSIHFDWVGGVFFSADGTPSQFYRVSDLDWVGNPAVITGVSVDFGGTPAGFDLGDVTFGDDYVDVTVGGTTWEAGAYVHITLETGQTGTVPEPASLAIFGFGALGLVAGGIRRRKRNGTAIQFETHGIK